MDKKTPTARESRGKYQTLVIVGAGVFLSTMDSSMVNVALPFIMRTFEAQLRQVQWVILIYLLSITVTLLFWGIVCDRIGKYRTYFAGIVIFLLSSVGCSLASSLPVLISIRFVEGLGAAMMMAAGPTIIRDVFPVSQLGRGLGLIGIATSAGLMSGPVIGGFLINSFSWRAIFLVCIPVSVIILVGGLVFMRKAGPGTTPAQPRRFDLKGALLWTGLISSGVLYGHYLPRLEPFGKLIGFIWLAALLLLFYLAEKSRKSNLLPLHLFSKNYYHIGLITAALSFGSLFVVLVLMPFYLSYARNLGADLIGLVMMAVPLTLFVVSPTAGYIFDRLGSKYLTTLGLIVCTLALLALATIDARTSYITICLSLACLGMGQAMFLVPNTASLLSRIGDDEAGITSGLLATSRNLGMLTGAAFAGMVFGAWYAFFTSGDELANFQPELVDPFISAFRATILCVSLVSLVNVMISWQRKG